MVISFSWEGLRVTDITGVDVIFRNVESNKASDELRKGNQLGERISIYFYKKDLGDAADYTIKFIWNYCFGVVFVVNYFVFYLTI